MIKQKKLFELILILHANNTFDANQTSEVNFIGTSYSQEIRSIVRNMFVFNTTRDESFQRRKKKYIGFEFDS